MEFRLPSNIIPWLFGSAALYTLGIRSYLRYRKLKSPLTKYFMISGFGAATGLFFYSVPFTFLSEQYQLKAAFIIGLIFIYLTLMYQSYFLWVYLFHKRINFAWLLVPTLGIGLSAMIVDAIDSSKSEISFIDGKVIYQVADYSRYAQSLILLLVVVVGGVLIQRSKIVEGIWPKIRLISVGVLYILIALSGIYDNIISYGQNDSKVVLVGYASAAFVFLVSMAIVIIKNRAKGVSNGSAAQ
jgi:hypothetical protein